MFFFFLFYWIRWGGRNRGQPELSLKNYLSVFFFSFQSSKSFVFWTDWGVNPKIDVEDIANRNHYMIDLTNITHDLIFLVSVLDLFICFVRVSLFCFVFFFLSFFYSSAYPNFPIFGNAALLLDELNV